MTIEMTDRKQAKIIKANYMLQAKIGAGPLDEHVVERCQEVMDRNDTDFIPMGAEYLDNLKSAIAQTKSGKIKGKTAIQNMTEPVMQLKANAATFRYPLISKLANVMLSFLETISSVDSDVIDIVQAHYTTLHTIVTKKIQGDGDSHGQLLEEELKAACQRYLAKKK